MASDRWLIDHRSPTTNYALLTNCYSDIFDPVFLLRHLCDVQIKAGFRQ